MRAEEPSQTTHSADITNRAAVEPTELLGPKIKRVAKAIRFLVAQAKTDMLRNVLATMTHDRDAWSKLLQFAGQCLGKPKGVGKKQKSLARWPWPSSRTPVLNSSILIN